MPATATATTARKTAADIIGSAVVNRAAQSATEQKKVVQAAEAAPSIQSNQFFKILMDASIDPEDKQSQITKLLTFTGTKEENKARIKAFEEFHEFLQENRKKMAVRIINLTDTETFSELQSCYKDMNTALIDFDNRMKPLTDIIDAIYELRTDKDGSKIMDTFKEIQEDKKKEEDHKRKLNDLDKEIDKIDYALSDNRSKIASLSEQKGFFGLGGIKEAARKEIAVLELKNEELTSRLDSASIELRNLQSSKKEIDANSDVARRKAKLRELLDLSSDTHNQRQKDLVSSALKFVQNASERVKSVRNHLGGMDTQIEGLLDANTRMGNIYAITSEALKDAEQENQRVRSQFDAPTETETLTRKSVREEKRMEVDNHIKALDSTAEATVSTYADISSQTMRIKTMKDANDDQQAKARVMSSQGISGVADRLSVVLQAVSQAAIGESSAMSKDSIVAMTERTNAIAQKEAIRVAMGGDEINNDIKKAIEDLTTYGEIYRTSTDIQRGAITELRQNLDLLKQAAQSVNKDVKDAIAVNAEIAKAEAPKTETSNQEDALI